MSYFRRKFNALAPQYRTPFRRFLTKVEKSPELGVDDHLDRFDKEVWSEVNCLVCSNCCRTMTPTYTFQDLRRIAPHFGMTIKAFKEKWLYKNKQGEWMNRQQPCQFLDRKTNLCTIYEIRPADCAQFPHLTKKPIADYMHVHKQNIMYCPATFRMVEKMMAYVRGK